ncbi:MAG TPA: ABC transporter permease [Acidimicrobiia bacterium]|nr:ABC transporter permease [Acidimicrobiia bacterium]
MSDDLYDPPDRPLEPTNVQPLDGMEASDAIRDEVRMDPSGGSVGAVTSGGLWRTVGREVVRKKSAIIGMALLSVLLLLAVFAPIIAPYPPDQVLFDEGVSPRDPPCIHLFGCPEDQPQHILGIDGNGRDYFARIVYGSRVSLLAAFAAVLFAVVWGTLIGLVSGFFGGWTDNVLMRIMDVLLSFPSLLLAIAVVTVLGPGLINSILAIAIVTIPQYARIVRSSVLSIREQEYVSADQALGVSRWRLLIHRIFPNTLTPLIVIATLGIATAVLEIASLSFLGLGVQPPTPEWGSMLAAERNQVFTAPHLVFFAGLMIMWNVLGFNLLGDGLRDAIDPRLGR